MIFILLFLLIMIMFIAYSLNSKDLLSPWVISIVMFTISVVVVIINYDYWDIDISAYTVLVIILALLAFGLGETLIRLVFISKMNKHSHVDFQAKKEKEIFISSKYIFLTCVFMIIISYSYYKHIYYLSLVVGNPGGVESMLKYARIALINLNTYNTYNELNYFVSQGLIISQCLTYFFIYVFLYNTIFIKYRTRYLICLFPVIIYSLQIILSTNRIPFVRLIPFFLLTLFIFWKKKNNWSNKLDIKIIKYSIRTFLLFIVFFYLLGFFTGKMENSSLRDTTSIYIGSPVVTLDIYLKSPPERDFFGKETLYGIYNILRKLNFNIPNYKPQLKPVSWHNGTSNIYTALRRYIQDYTIGGMLFIEFFIGLLYGGFLHKIKYNKIIGKDILIYSMFFFPIIESAWDERFLNIIFTARTVYLYIYISIIYWFFIKIKQKRIRMPSKCIGSTTEKYRSV